MRHIMLGWLYDDGGCACCTWLYEGDDWDVEDAMRYADESTKRGGPTKYYVFTYPVGYPAAFSDTKKYLNEMRKNK